MERISKGMVLGLAAVVAIAVAGTANAQLYTQDFDSLGVFGGFPVSNLPGWSGDANGSSTVNQNGGSTDPDWTNWGGPSVGAVGIYNQGMEDEQDRALGLYKTGVAENPMYLEYAITLATAVPGLEIVFDVEVPMARYTNQVSTDKNFNTTVFNVLVDGALAGSSGTLDNSGTALTAWNWSDDSVHYWLNDAEMDAGGKALRSQTVTTGPLAAGTHTIRWEIPTGGTYMRLHTGLDNVVISEVPEPASLALLGLGAAALIRRRRQA